MYQAVKQLIGENINCAEKSSHEWTCVIILSLRFDI